MLILVDCGTTNMRLRLYHGAEHYASVDELLHQCEPLFELKRKLGVRDAARGGAEVLERALGDAVRELVSVSAVAASDIEAVICSGTLSSWIGIYHIHHTVMPTSPRDTAAHSELVSMPQVCDIPIFFIPGVKGVGGLMETEVMSGEECELYGIAERMGIRGAFTLLLPGSYNKIISAAAGCRIERIYSSMSGELTAAVSENTLLRKAVPSPVIRTIIPDMLRMGADTASKYGLSPALSKVWIMSRLGKTQDEAANFMMGAMLEGDMRLMSELPVGQPVYVGGSSPLRELFFEMLSIYGIGATEVSPDAARIAPNIGAMMIYYMHKGLI